MNAIVITLGLLSSLVLQFVSVQLSHADEPSNPIFSNELDRQTQIYQSRGRDRPEGYVIDRSLSSYSLTLPYEFGRSLAGLGEGDRWLDIGAGEGRAILDYCTGNYEGTYSVGEPRPGKKARVVAMSIEDRRTNQWHQTAASLAENQIRYLSGRRLSQYSMEELGQFRMITDVLGGFSYTDNLSRFTETALALLEVNGSLFTVLQDVKSESGENQPHYAGSPFLTEIADVDGTELKVCSWLKRIGCVEVSCEFKPDFEPPVEVYRIHKVCSNVTVPALTPVHYQAGTPPERRFRMTPSSKREAMTSR